jgi:hypothetical protein
MSVRASELTTNKNPVTTDELYLLGDQSPPNPAGEGVSIDDVLNLGLQTITFRDALDTVTAVPHLLTGEYREVGNTQSANVTTDFSLANQHLYIDVQTVTTGGVITVTGASVDESTGVVTDDDTEVITITNDNGVLYQTDKKWWEVTTIDVETGDIDTIDFDYGVVGYLDFGNKNFKIHGFRAEFEADGATPDILLRIRKIQDEGSKVFTVVTMEEIGFDATVGNGVIDDNKRTAGDSRAFTFGATALADGQMLCLKNLDYNTFYTSDENIMESATKAEGIIVDFIGSPSGNINAVAHATVTLYYSHDIN